MIVMQQHLEWVNSKRLLPYVFVRITQSEKDSLGGPKVPNRPLSSTCPSSLIARHTSKIYVKLCRFIQCDVIIGQRNSAIL